MSGASLRRPGAASEGATGRLVRYQPTMASSLRGLLAVLVLTSCKTPASAPARVALVSAPDAAPGTAPADVDADAVAPGAQAGDLHQTQIITVDIAADASAAVSVDQGGRALIWPTLDGTVPSRKLPVRGWRQAAIGRSGDRLLAAFVNAADSLEVVGTDRLGGDQTRAVLPPTSGVAKVAIVDGQVVAIGTDQALLLVDAGGTILDRVTARETRLLGVVPTTAGAVVVARVVSGGTPAYQARRLHVRAGKLELGPGVPLPGPPGREVFAASPDARVLAYPGATLVPGVAQQPLVLVDLERPHLAITTTLTLGASGQLAFTGPRELGLVELSSANLVRLDLGPSPTVQTLPLGLPRSNGWRLGVGGTAVGPADTSLLVIAPDGRTRYVGHRFAAPSQASLAPSGEVVAWHTTEAVVVERVDRRWRRVIRWPAGTVAQASLIDDDHLLVALAGGALQLVALRGQASPGPDSSIDAAQLVLDEVSSLAGASFEFEGSTRLVAVGLGGAAALWRVSADGRTFGPRMLVPEAQVFLLHADTGHALAAVAGKSVRRYTLDELRAGVTAEQAKDGRVELTAMPRIDRIDRRGRALHLTWRATPTPGHRVVIFADAAGVMSETALGNAATLEPSPRGDRLLTFDSSNTTELRDLAGVSRWRLPTPSTPGLRWSGDGRHVVITAGGGGLVVDAETGQIELRGCGWMFGAHATPPPRRFGNNPICAE